jgi:hypothetical protein
MKIRITLSKSEIDEAIRQYLQADKYPEAPDDAAVYMRYADNTFTKIDTDNPMYIEWIEGED